VVRGEVGGWRSGVPDTRRVEYDVNLMVVLRCTQSLLLRLKRFDEAPDVRCTTKLGDWYGNLIRMGNRHVLLFISERSRLPIIMPVREANRLRSSFPEAVCQMLGSLNDFSMMARMHFITRRTDPLERIARDLAETPLILPFAGAHPSAVTRRLLDADWTS
jgi:hypothetical protein